jgi:hypothetical protein
MKMAAVVYNVIYKGRDNTLALQLSSTDELGVVTYPDLADSVTKIDLILKGYCYDSTDYPTAFNFATEGDLGILILKLGLITDLQVVKDSAAEIIIYDASNPEGIVWGTLPIKVIQLVGADPGI